ncbi:MAG: membrane protein insertase YidC [Pseudomonadota bacterium]
MQKQGGGDDTRNLILAAVLSMLVVVGWFAIFPPTPPQDTVPEGTSTEGQAAPVPGAPPAQEPLLVRSRDQALELDERVPIQTDIVWGSIRLEGGRIDDLHLSKYFVTQEPGSDTVVLLNPEGGPDPYHIDYGWSRTQQSSTDLVLPDPETVWSVESGNELTPSTPIVLVWDNGKGLIFRRKVEIDEQYMFTVTQSVENTGTEEVALAPFGKVSRREGLSTTALWILHEGAVAQVDDELQEIDYDDLLEIAPNPETGARFQYFQVQANGWLGFTDKYWMTTLIPTPGTAFDAFYLVDTRSGQPEFEAMMRQKVVTIAPGSTEEAVSHVFAGAKEFATLESYQEEMGVYRFIDSIDWGWFYWLTKPIFRLLAFVQSFIGNMGWSIIVLTLIVKAVLFPLAYKSYVSMSKMKKLQPEMEKIKERTGDDRQKLQQEMMALYKKEKVNPAAGCLPILLQIPIFFSLYKVLFVTIEMRHAPFTLWITDLSAPDPTSILNVFGLMPWDVPDPTSIFAIFSIGVFPILMGVTMWLQQKLNPAPTDPTQAMIFAWMPWVFMFMLGSFASGLVIYWVANNTITFIQQYIIMRSQGVDVDIFGNIKSSFKKRKPEPEKK